MNFKINFHFTLKQTKNENISQKNMTDSKMYQVLNESFKIVSAVSA